MLKWSKGGTLGLPSPILFLDGEGVTSPGIHPRRGLLQGCPLAPAMSKLTLNEPLRKLTSVSAVSHADLWLDDISVDCIHKSPLAAAEAGPKAFVAVSKASAASLWLYEIRWRHGGCGYCG